MEVPNKDLEGLRTDEAFHGIFASCIIRCEELAVEAPKLPRVRNRPKRYGVRSSTNHQWGSDEENVRVQYFKFLDTAMTQWKKIYEQPGIKTYIKLENVIVKPVTSCSEIITAVDQYPELDGSTLYIQLAMVKQMTALEELSLDLVVAKLECVDHVVLKLFPQVDMLVRLLLIIPCSSAEADRSFSDQRRLKSYMRNSMT